MIPWLTSHAEKRRNVSITQGGAVAPLGCLAVPPGSEAQRLARQAHRESDESKSCNDDRLGLQQVTVSRDAAILDVGCGGGWTVRKLAAMSPDGKVFGLDYSAASVAVSRDTNARQIEAGQVQIEEGSVAALPFPDCTFDIVTAVETHYYWPDLPANVREVLRVLKPGGSFALIAETYRGGPFRVLYGIVMPLLRAEFLSDDEHRNLLAQAGFVEVVTKHLTGKNWICATGRRPAT